MKSELSTFCCVWSALCWFVRSGLFDALRDRPHSPLTGDFSLNAANSLTADALLRLGFERIDSDS